MPQWFDPMKNTPEGDLLAHASQSLNIFATDAAKPILLALSLQENVLNVKPVKRPTRK